MAEIVVHHSTLWADADELARCAALLSPEERAWAKRFRFARDRRRFIMRRSRLRQRLGIAAGYAPEMLTFQTTEHGKPYLEDGPDFSASHSGEQWILANGSDAIGVDIERIDPMLDWPGLARAFFAPEEIAGLLALTADEGRKAFFRVWTGKEAFVKAVGSGLSHPLAAFALSTGELLTFVRGGEGWRIAALPAPPGYAAALVARDDGAPLVITPAPPAP